MSHKDRSIANSRTEAKRIYHQRREINKLQQEIEHLKETITNIRNYCNLYTRLSAEDILKIIDEVKNNEKNI